MVRQQLLVLSYHSPSAAFLSALISDSQVFRRREKAVHSSSTAGRRTDEMLHQRACLLVHFLAAASVHKAAARCQVNSTLETKS